eukprot:1830358-Pleurochrysis_carterae.AAC.1
MELRTCAACGLRTALLLRCSYFPRTRALLPRALAPSNCSFASTELDSFFVESRLVVVCYMRPARERIESVPTLDEYLHITHREISELIGNCCQCSAIISGHAADSAIAQARRLRRLSSSTRRGRRGAG